MSQPAIRPLYRTPAPNPRDTPSCLPELPPGCSDQAVFSFHEQNELVLYEFRQVYRQRQRILDRELIWVDELDENRCYWLAMRAAPTIGGDEYPVGRWLTYAQARAQPGPPLSFRDFSQLRDSLPFLLPA
jgi:hypothetical protein